MEAPARPVCAQLLAAFGTLSGSEYFMYLRKSSLCFEPIASSFSIYFLCFAHFLFFCASALAAFANLSAHGYTHYRGASLSHSSISL